MTRKNLRTVGEGVTAGFAAYLGAQAIFAVAVSVLYYLLVPFAHAQTYVRPSKGTSIQIANRLAPGNNVGSALFDFSAFSEVQLTVQAFDANTNNPAPFGTCSNTFISNIVSGPNKTGPLGNTQQGYFTDCEFAISQGSQTITTHSAADLGQYVQVFVSVGAAGSAFPRCRVSAFAPVPCKFDVFMTPMPFSSNITVRPPYTAGDNVGLTNAPLQPFIGGAVAQNNVAVPLKGFTFGGTLNPGNPSALVVTNDLRLNASQQNIVTFAATPTVVASITTDYYTGIRVQNTGTVPVICDGGPLPLGYTLSATRYGFALAAGTANDDGKGGSLELDGLRGSVGASGMGVTCVALSGTGRVAAIYY